jgi:hypothetical protein
MDGFHGTCPPKFNTFQMTIESQKHDYQNVIQQPQTYKT